MHCLWLARGNEILVGECVLWHMDLMTYVLLAELCQPALGMTVKRYYIQHYICH